VEDISSFPHIHSGVTVTSVDNTIPVEGTAPQITETQTKVGSDDPFAGQKGDVVDPFSTNGAKTGDVPVGSPPKNDRRLSSDEWGKLHDFFSLFFPFCLIAPLHAFTPFSVEFKGAEYVLYVEEAGLQENHTQTQARHHHRASNNAKAPFTPHLTLAMGMWTRITIEMPHTIRN